MNLNQALKYGAKEDLIKGILHADQIDPTALLVLADAHEEQGQEGIADVLRAVGRGERGVGRLRVHANGPSFGPKHPERNRIKTPFVYGSVQTLTSADLPHSTKPDKATFNLGFADNQTGSWRLHSASLPPEEAKAATARLPNAAEIHQFIDSHFNAPTETQ